MELLLKKGENKKWRRSGRYFEEEEEEEDVLRTWFYEIFFKTFNDKRKKKTDININFFIFHMKVVYKFS